MASQWVCIGRRAWSHSSANFGTLVYPMQFEEPNCEKIDGVNTRTCHGADGAWWKGNKATTSDFAQQMSDAYKNFWHSGSGSPAAPIGSDDQVFNRLSETHFASGAAAPDTGSYFGAPYHCGLMDELHDEFNWYNWGVTELDDDSLVENTAHSPVPALPTLSDYVRRL